jgi:serine/threonine protein kinase
MTEMIGQIIGNCRIEAPLGVGGMGQVYRARHVQLGRLQAVKILHAELADNPEFQAQFRREAAVIAGLRHPHITRIFDYGAWNGREYLVMELLPGGSLKEILRQQPDCRQQRARVAGLDLLRQAAAGLAHAHARGIVHRDIKPGNLLLLPARHTRTVSGYLLKVSDFGLAHLVTEQAQAVGQAGSSTGTPAYMAPEQFQGQAVDARSDLYALGMILYELVTGRPPFGVRSLGEAAFNHRYTHPVAPRQVCPDLPAELDDIIMCCLMKHPDERSLSAAALADALRTLVGTLTAPGATGRDVITRR